MDHLKEVQAYWDKRSHGFSDAINEEADSELGRQWKERFRKLLGEQPLEILDDGAGAGFFSMLLTSLGHHVTSIDYSEKMVERLRENMASRGLAASALQMDAQKLEFPDGRFDAVVQRNVLWNLDDPAAAYGEMHRVLRPGGLLLVDDGNHYLASHDEEYAAENERLRQRRLAEGAGRPADPGDHYAHNPEQVDFTIIERIASEQPLSYVRRPQWDVDQLIRLGFFDLQIHIDGERLPRHFLISARKKAE